MIPTESDKPERAYYFGTDIPMPSDDWAEIEQARAMDGSDDAGYGPRWILVAVAIFLITVALVVYMAMR